MKFAARRNNDNRIFSLYGLALRLRLLPWLLVLIGVATTRSFALDTTTIDGLVAKAGNAIGVCVVDLDQSKTVYERNATTPLKPASVQKLLITAAALSKLGPEYRFHTDLFVSGREGTRADTVYIRGGGDPSMTTERLWLLARELQVRGLHRITELVFDDSAFQDEKNRQGQRAFLTGSSALSLNFNSITIRACPSAGPTAFLSADPWEAGVGLQGKVKSNGNGPSRIAVDSKSDSSLNFRVSGSVDRDGGCVAAFRSVPAPERYFAEVFRSYLGYIGVQVPRKARFGPTPETADFLLRFESEPLRDIIRGMNQFSNNFVAEQLLFALGENGTDARLTFSRELGKGQFRTFIDRIGNFDGLELVDASGLSHENRTPARLFCSVLDKLYKDFPLNTEFMSSLAVSGRNGTLKEREFGQLSPVVRGKTGTLDGVSSIAGLTQSKDGTHYAFAIIQNRGISKPDAVQLEDRLVQQLIGG